MRNPIINDGGPAFPMQEPQAIHAKAAAAIAHIPTDQTEERDRAYMQARADAVGGMSLRDHFAGLAMQDLLALCQGDHQDGVNYPDHVARLSFEMADAMLKARAGEAS